MDDEPPVFAIYVTLFYFSLLTLFFESYGNNVQLFYNIELYIIISSMYIVYL